MVQRNKKQSAKPNLKEEKKAKAGQKEEKKSSASESTIQDYYEAESWQFSGCGD